MERTLDYRSMNYLDRFAINIYRRVEPVGDPSDDEMALYRIYAMLALAKGKAATLEDVHNAWSAWMSGLTPSHRSLIPFGELDPSVQELDRPYLEAIHGLSDPGA